MQGSARRAVVLLSGGIDSATSLAWAVHEGYEAHALTVRYGQRHEEEIERAVRLAAALGAASHVIARLDPGFASGSALTDPTVAVPKDRTEREMASGIPVTYVPARNTILLSLALARAEVLGAADLVLGVNAVDYSGYPDCRPAFLEAYEKLAAVATRAGVEGKRFRIHAPLLRLSKGQIIRRAVELGVDLGLTLSCYDPDARGRPCGACDACRLREKGFREAGLVDPAVVNQL